MGQWNKSVVIDPASVAANTTAEQTFNVSGLKPLVDVVTAIKPTNTVGITVGNVRVSAVDTLAISFGNHTAAAVDPASETWLLRIDRDEGLPLPFGL